MKVSIFALYLVTVSFIFHSKIWVVPTDGALLQALPGKVSHFKQGRQDDLKMLNLFIYLFIYF